MSKNHFEAASARLTALISELQEGNERLAKQLDAYKEEVRAAAR